LNRLNSALAPGLSKVENANIGEASAQEELGMMEIWEWDDLVRLSVEDSPDRFR
jgi:hypothetical protein